MPTPRKKKPLQIDLQQTNQYSYILGQPLHLIKTKPITQDDYENRIGNALAGGRRSTDRDSFHLYFLWLSLSPREQDVTFLACQGYKNQKIAFEMGISATTVKSYLRLVFLKIQARNKTELCLKFVNFDFKLNPPPIARSIDIP